MPAPRELLRDADGQRRTNEEILAEHGNIGLRRALLDDAMHGLGDERSVSYPPRVFLSYKWESDEHKQWVAALADELMAHGWEVVVDRDYDESVHRTVESFVAQLRTCGIFIAVATPAYVANAIYPPGHNPSWVFDECQAAMLGELRMHRIALTPDGSLRVPEERDEIFRASHVAHETGPSQPWRGLAISIESAMSPNFDEILPMPARDELASWVSAHMSFDGPRLPGDAADQLAAELSAIGQSTIGQSIVDGAGCEDSISRIDELIASWPQVSTLRQRQVQLLVAAGRKRDALGACIDALQAVDRRDGWRRLARTRLELHEELGDRAGSFEAALDLLGSYANDWTAQVLVGNYLDDLDQTWAARNHLLIAAGDDNAPGGVHNVLGVVYQRLGLLACAMRSFQRALELDPATPHAADNLAMTVGMEPRHNLSHRLKADIDGIGCTNCASIYTVTDEHPVICARCGTTRSASGACPACAADGVVAYVDGLPVPFQCPTCRRGGLERRDHFDL